MLWGPLFVFLFPDEFYGLVAGSIELCTQVAALMNLPMLKYNTRNDEYATMNYLIAGLMFISVVLPLSCYRRYKLNIKSKSDFTAF